MAYRCKHALDRVRGSKVLPVLGGEIVEREQGAAVLGEAVGGLCVFEPISFDERVEYGFGGGLRLGRPDLVQRALGLWLLVR
jgi:hypothetical protein